MVQNAAYLHICMFKGLNPQKILIIKLFVIKKSKSNQNVPYVHIYISKSLNQENMLFIFLFVIKCLNEHKTFLFTYL